VKLQPTVDSPTTSIWLHLLNTTSSRQALRRLFAAAPRQACSRISGPLTQGHEQDPELVLKLVKPNTL